MKVCDTCGAEGFPECLIICTQCGQRAEHLYCIWDFHDAVPSSWVCESCQLSRSQSFNQQKQAFILSANRHNKARAWSKVDTQKERMSRQETEVVELFYRRRKKVSSLAASNLLQEQPSENLDSNITAAHSSKQSASNTSQIRELKQAPSPSLPVTLINLPHWKNSHVRANQKVNETMCNSNITGNACDSHSGNELKSSVSGQKHSGKASQIRELKQAPSPSLPATLINLPHWKNSHVRANQKVNETTCHSNITGNACDSHSGNELKSSVSGQKYSDILDARSAQGLPSKELNSFRNVSEQSSPLCFVSKHSMGSGNHEQLRVEHSNSPPERKPGFSAPLKKKTSAEMANNVSEESVSIIDSVTSDVQSTPHVQLLWRGSFSVSSISDRVRVFKQIQGHPSVKAEPKVWEIARSMPDLLNSREFRRDIDENTLHECFHSLPLSVENVDVFFFPVDMDSYDCWYKPLIDRMISYDLVLRVDLPNATLLVFHSQLLREVDRLWEDRHYLWGVFRDKEHHVIQREALLYHAEGAGDNAEVVDMEIDMVGCDDMHASTIIIGENVLNPSSKRFPIEVSPLPLGFQPVDTKMPAKNTDHEDSLVGVSLPPGFQPVHTKMLVKNTNPEDSLVEVSLPPGFQPVDTKMPVQNTNHEDSTPPLPADAPLPAGFAPVDTMPQVKNAVFKAFIPPLPSDSLFPPGFAPPNMFQQSKSTNREVFVPPLPLRSPPWHPRFTPENMWQFKNTNHEVRNPPLPPGTMRGPVFTPVGNLMQFKINCEMFIPPLPPGPPPPEPPPPEPPPP